MAKAKRSWTTKDNGENEILTTIAGFKMVIAATVIRIETAMSNSGNKNRRWVEKNKKKRKENVNR